MKVMSSLLALLAVSCLCNVVLADNQPMWVGTWGSSLAGLPTEAKMGSYEYPSTAIFRGTIRYRLRISLGGSQVRLRISNEYGDKALDVAAVSIGIAGEGFNAVPGSLKRASFGGKSFIAERSGG